MADKRDDKYVPAPTPKVTESVPPVELLTEQEQNVYSEGGNGVGPTTPSAQSVPIETMEDQGIGPRTPYPTGNPPPPTEDVTLSQGIWKGDETNDGTNVPNKTKGPVDPRPQPRIGGAQEVATPPRGPKP